MNLLNYFAKPSNARQRQYEAVRAVTVDKQTVHSVAKKFGYSVSTIYSLLRDTKSGKLELFPCVALGQTKRRTPDYIQKEVVKKRHQNKSAKDIRNELVAENFTISIRTVERVLQDAHLPKLKRRPKSQQKITVKNQHISERTTSLTFDDLEPFRYDCPVIGIFFFLPYIIESGILEILTQCSLPQSSVISSTHACLSMLALKLIGTKRLSHIKTYDHEPGLGLFAGLNVLPKATYMNTYSCRTSDAMLFDFQKKVVAHFQKIYPTFYNANFINLDFHSIPHFGNESNMEKVWCGARGKSMKGANTIFAQDADSNIIMYTKADILRKDEATAVLQFVDYWKKIKSCVNETLVFDCKLTTYKTLDQLSCDNVKFITLRKRNQKLLTQTAKIPAAKWQQIYLPIPKRMHKSCSAHENVVTFDDCETQLRQIIIKNHGRAEPTFIITNNHELPLKEILIVYAKRWHVENKLAELVSFFNLNALSSPLMIRIHFDIIWTIISDTLYHRFAQDLPRFEQERADTIFRQFINAPGQIIYNGNEFIIRIRKRAHTPILMGVKKLQQAFCVPWLNNLPVRIEWTA